MKTQNIIKLLYSDLENVKKYDIYDNSKKFLFNHTKYEKKGILPGNNGKYKLPAYTDTISMIYNYADYPIKFSIIIHDLVICDVTVNAKSFVYPLYNNSIFPLFLFDEYYYPFIMMENNLDLSNLTIVCTNFSNRQRKYIKLNEFYYFKNYDNKYDVIYNGEYCINHDIIEDEWININKIDMIDITI